LVRGRRALKKVAHSGEETGEGSFVPTNSEAEREGGQSVWTSTGKTARGGELKSQLEDHPWGEEFRYQIEERVIGHNTGGKGGGK